MKHDTIESYRRVRGNDFSARFYARLLASNADIKRRFARTDFGRQHELFQHGLLMMLEFAHGSAVGKIAMQRIAALHGPTKLDVPARHYETWVRCVLATVAELDPEWSPALEAKWRADLEAGVAWVRHVEEARV